MYLGWTTTFLQFALPLDESSAKRYPVTMRRLVFLGLITFAPILHAATQIDPQDYNRIFSPDPSVREAGLRSIANYSDDQKQAFAQQVLWMMRGRGGQDWQYSTDALVRLGAPAVPVLCHSLNGGLGNPSAAYRALLAEKPPLDQILSPLSETLKGNFSDGRRHALIVLEAYGTSATAKLVPQITSMLDDKDLFTRAQAAGALANIGPSAASAVPALVKRLEDAEDVRKKAEEALNVIGTPEAKQALQDYSQSETYSTNPLSIEGQKLTNLQSAIRAVPGALVGKAKNGPLEQSLISALPSGARKECQRLTACGQITGSKMSADVLYDQSSGANRTLLIGYTCELPRSEYHTYSYLGTLTIDGTKYSMAVTKHDGQLETVPVQTIATPKGPAAGITFYKRGEASNACVGAVSNHEERYAEFFLIHDREVSTIGAIPIFTEDWEADDENGDTTSSYNAKLAFTKDRSGRVTAITAQPVSPSKEKAKVYRWNQQAGQYQ